MEPIASRQRRGPSSALNPLITPINAQTERDDNQNPLHQPSIDERLRALEETVKEDNKRMRQLRGAVCALNTSSTTQGLRLRDLEALRLILFISIIALHTADGTHAAAIALRQAEMEKIRDEAAVRDDKIRGLQHRAAIKVVEIQELRRDHIGLLGRFESLLAKCQNYAPIWGKESKWRKDD